MIHVDLYFVYFECCLSSKKQLYHHIFFYIGQNCITLSNGFQMVFLARTGNNTVSVKQP